MYTLLLIIMLAIAGFIIYRGIVNKKAILTSTGIITGLVTILFFWFMSFWGEMLWFEQLGYNERFWKLWGTKLGLFISAFVTSGLLVYLLTYSLKNGLKYARYIAVTAGAFIGAFWWYSRWDIVLKFMNSVPTEISDPVLHKSVGFYLFQYPFIKASYNVLLYLVLISLGANLLGTFSSGKNQEGYVVKRTISQTDSIYVSMGIVLLILAAGRYIRRFGLLFSEFGVVHGPGWTDDHIRMPVLTSVAIITAAFALLIMIPQTRHWICKKILNHKSANPDLSVIYSMPGLLLIIWILLLGVVPALFQWLKVEPNEITVEKPYIEHNINFTRQGFHLNKVEVNEFPAANEFSRSDVDKNKSLFSNIRLWDYRALDAVFKQFQEIRLYYEFSDVDIDRYHINDEYREVMVSAREMEPGNLPASSQTFINTRFKYTHGYGIVLTRVNEFTPEGLPNLLIKDIPPVSQYNSLKVERPEIYYGELTNDYVVVNSKEQEFDYPSGENNIYTTYTGNGGVQLSDFWRKLLYGWKLGGTRFLLSGYPSDESRVMIHRQIIDRVKTLAPFLYFDDDPYIVFANGELYWILDAYTTSRYYPYSETFFAGEAAESGKQINPDRHFLLNRYLRGQNYLRNSVKITINAYNGEVNFYIFEENDPLIQVYDNIFPGLLSKKDKMPEALREHVRYPADMLLVQGLMYAKYHMTDPTVFYNQEDLWVRATEKYYANVQAVEPYYIMWEPPESDETEFVLMLPFTPKNKQVMIGWIAGMCDGENYGRFLAYKFPKEKRILGTQQVETKIDQDSYLSGQLTLWDQRGSNVIRGNVLAIPIDKTVIYVEPVYLQSQTAAYPELRLVCVMHDDQLSYAETFEKALQNLFTEGEKAKISSKSILTGDENMKELIENANEAFENYLDNMNKRDFSEAGKALQELEQNLQKLSEKSKDSNI